MGVSEVTCCHDADFAAAAQCHNKMLKYCFDTMTLFQVENFKSFMSASGLELLSASVLTATTTVECDQTSVTCEDKKRLIDQFIATLTTAKSVPAGERKKHMVEQKKEIETAAKTLNEQDKLLQMKRKMVANGDTTLFTLSRQGHESLPMTTSRRPRRCARKNRRSCWTRLTSCGT